METNFIVTNFWINVKYYSVRNSQKSKVVKSKVDDGNCFDTGIYIVYTSKYDNNDTKMGK